MVCKLNRKGYVLKKSEATEEQKRKIENELQIKLIDELGFKDPVIYNAYLQDEDNYYLPRYWGLNNIDPNPEIAFRKTSRANINFNYNGFAFKREQIPLIRKLYDQYLQKNIPMKVEYQDKIINARTGIGKSALALNLSCLLKKRTIIVVHTREIILQWKEAIEKHVLNAKVGYIKGKKYLIDGCDFVIVTVQSLMKPSIPVKALLSDFDTIIYDEAHHYCSPVFSNVLRNIVTRYTISLSATMEKTHESIYWYLGGIGVKTEGQLDFDIEIDVIDFTPKEKGFFRELKLGPGKLNCGKMMSNLVKIKERNDAIICKVDDILHKQPERHILIISHRTDQMEYFADVLSKKYGQENIGLIVGKTGEKIIKDPSMANYHGKKIIIGIYNLCKESINIPELCCVVLATPMSAILQSCGRMLRKKKHEYIHNPLVVDFRDTLKYYNNMGKTRLRQYSESYLNAENSALRFYKCSWETNYKIEYVRTEDLKKFNDSMNNQKKYSKFKNNNNKNNSSKPKRQIVSFESDDEQ